jgi:hypothetical protein
MNRPLASLLVALAVSASYTSSAAAAPKEGTTAEGKRTCDTTKIHTGPRGGKYRVTADCQKVYIKKKR